MQYAYARINSIVRTLKINLDEQLTINAKEFQPNEYEKDIKENI